MNIFYGLLWILPLIGQIFVEAQIPRSAYDRIRNFKPEKFTHAIGKQFPTWETIFKKLNENSTIFDNLDINSTCLNDILLPWYVISSNQTTYDKQPFMTMIDSSAAIGPGILRGHQWFYGLYTECKSVNYKLPGENRKFEGLYTRILISQNVLIDPAKSAFNDSGTCDSVLGIDVCFPKSCSDNDLLEITRNITDWNAFHLFFHSDGSPVCDVKTMRDDTFTKKNFGTWLVIVIMVFILFLGVTASIYDYFLYPLHKNEAYTKSIGVKCWRAFSLYTNISETFNTKGSKKAGQISPIHCMRFFRYGILKKMKFFSLCWVVMGHSLGFFMIYSENPADVLDITKDWTIQWVTNAYFAVDTFFFQSGLLLAFIWFKKYQSNKRQTNSAMAWVMFYVHRILRLSPAYYMLIAFYTFVYLPILVANKPVFLNPFNEPCPQYWWVNFLYLNNYIHYDKQCYLVSWYLSTDLQIYIFAPLLILPFTFGPLFGLVSALIAFLLSTVANIITVIHFRFPPSDFSLGPLDPKMTTPYSHYTYLIYNAPWIRCQIFIIGMMVGYLLQNKKKLKIPWAINIILWVVCFVVMWLDIIALRSWSGEHHYMSLGYRTLYSAFSKPVWGLCLAWIITSCYYGYGGFINDFMSWNIWVPLGRLSYSAYLIHICCMLYITGMSQNGTTYTSFPQMIILFVLPVIVVTYFFAIFWSGLFEFGFGKVEDALIGMLIGRPVSSRNVQPIKEEVKEMISPPKENNNDWTIEVTTSTQNHQTSNNHWETEAPVNGDAKYTNETINNNVDDKE